MISRKIDDRVFFLTRQIVSTSSTERVASAVNRVIPIPVADHIRLRPTDTTSAGRSTHGGEPAQTERGVRAFVKNADPLVFAPG